MLASELLRRLVPSGSGLDVAAGGALAAARLLSQAGGKAVLAVGETGTIDYLAANTTYPLSGLDAATGKTALLCVSRFSITARTGTATGTATYQGGNNVAVDNMWPTTSGAIAAATVNTTAFTLPFSLLGISQGTMIDMSTGPLKMKWVTPFGGASVLQGKFYCAIWYV